jgi:hypothetical protein
MFEKGEIRNKDIARNLVLYKGMRWENITPTDIDGCIDFQDKVFIFFEVKHGKTNVTVGQKILLERLVNRINKSGAFAYALICKHFIDGDVTLKECIVHHVYNGQWSCIREKGITVEESVKRIRKKHKL